MKQQFYLTILGGLLVVAWSMAGEIQANKAAQEAWLPKQPLLSVTSLKRRSISSHPRSVLFIAKNGEVCSFLPIQYCYGDRREMLIASANMVSWKCDHMSHPISFRFFLHSALQFILRKVCKVCF